MMKLVLRFDWVNWKYKISKNIILDFFTEIFSDDGIRANLARKSFEIECILPFQNDRSEAFMIHCTKLLAKI